MRFLEGIHTATYLFHTMAGFVNGHTYLIEIRKERSIYLVEAIKDLTDHTYSDATLPFASGISIRQHWQFHEDVDN